MIVTKDEFKKLIQAIMKISSHSMPHSAKFLLSCTVLAALPGRDDTEI